MAEQWLQLEDSAITTDDVQNILGQVNDDRWVVSACVDRVVGSPSVQHALLNLGISRSQHVIDKCTSIVALSSTSPDQPVRHTDALLSHFENTPVDAQVCYLRSVLLRRLDRLNTYVEMEKVFPQKSEIVADEDMEEWEDNPWADGNDMTTDESTLPLRSSEVPPLSLSEFLQNDLLWSACKVASATAIEAVCVLFRRHTSVLWPSRFKILESIPEHSEPSICRDIFPSLDNTTNAEVVLVQDSWRQSLDFVELPETLAALQKFGESSPFTDSAKEIPFLPVLNPLTPMELSTWYKHRVNSVISTTGMISLALAVVQHGAAQGIPFLDELGEDLSLLSRLVYDAPQGKDVQEDWTLTQWHSMDPISVVKANLAHSTPDTLARDIWRLVMPYLYVLEARAERIGHSNPLLLTRTLYDYILTTSLDNAAAIFEASKPTHPLAQRIIKDDEDMARLALACLYGSNSLHQWTTMSSIFECLPVWEMYKDDGDHTVTANATVASLGSFVTPNTNNPPATPSDLLKFFEPLPFGSLSQALDILDVHLESGEILFRWHVPAPLRWFLQSSGNVSEQRAWANRMARRAGGKQEPLNSIEDWERLLKDMLKLTGSGDSTARGAFCLLTREEIMTIFLGSLLINGHSNIAKMMLYGPDSKIFLSPEAVENASLSCSRELYDNATSGNYKTGDMKLAYDCLDVPRPSSNLTREKEFIEATSRITSFSVLTSPGVPISPIEIRLTKDRLSLISRVLSSNTDAYKHTKVILELCSKLGYRDDPVAEVKVLAMLADTALQTEDFHRAFENTERMIAVISYLRSGELDEKMQELADVCWVACFQLGRQPEFQDLAKKLTLLGHALELCPPDKIHDILSAWRKLEVENIDLRRKKLQQPQNGEPRKTTRHNAESTSTNVASSLRARLKDLQVPSPPLLSSPDAATLASRTFKSVAANFPFAVGHRAQSDAEERDSGKSEGSARTDVEDVSSQATRVLTKGIGWLIGADGDI